MSDPSSTIVKPKAPKAPPAPPKAPVKATEKSTKDARPEVNSSAPNKNASEKRTGTFGSLIRGAGVALSPNRSFTAFIYALFIAVLVLTVYGFVTFYGSMGECRRNENTLGPNAACSMKPCFQYADSCHNCSLGYVMDADMQGYSCRSNSQWDTSIAGTEGCFADAYELIIVISDATNTASTAENAAITKYTHEHVSLQMVELDDFSTASSNTSLNPTKYDGVVTYEGQNKKIMKVKLRDLIDETKLESFRRRCKVTLKIELTGTETSRFINSVSQDGMSRMHSTLTDDTPLIERTRATITLSPQSKKESGTITVTIGTRT